MTTIIVRTHRLSLVDATNICELCERTTDRIYRRRNCNNYSSVGIFCLSSW